MINDNTITPFRKDNKYTDFRVMMRDLLNNSDIATARGIVVWIKPDGDIQISGVCSSSQMAFAAAHMLQKSVNQGD